MSAQQGCHFNLLVNTEGATWGVARAFRLPDGALVRRPICRAPLTPPKIGASCAILYKTTAALLQENSLGRL